MRKTKFKLEILLMTAVLLFTTVFVGYGCNHNFGGSSVNEEIDETRTQLNIGVFGGGFGTEWIRDLKVRFEEYTKDMSFQDGRKGVQIFYQEDKDKYKASSLVTQISYDSKDLYFASGDEIDSFISQNLVLEITDVMTEPLTEFNETKSPEDKLSDEQVAHFKRNDKYYVCPDNVSSLGIIYDIDLFEQKKLYFAKGGAPSEYSKYTQENNDEPATGTFTEYKYTNDVKKASAGPDAKYGTFDDGCPATTEEFNQLLERMKRQGVDSMIWTELYADQYTNFLHRSMWLDYHGVKEADIMYKGEKCVTDIITGFLPDGTPIIEQTEIGIDNYKDLAKQAGRYYGLKMMEDILKSGTVSTKSFESLSHTRTQDKFLTSRFRMGEKPIAMMIEGTWWENEAKESGIFASNVEEFGEKASSQNRRFGLMPMPKVSEEFLGEPSTIISGSSTVFINANMPQDKIGLAKLFLRFSMTDESLRRFTVQTGIPKSMNYELTEEDRAQMSTFSKQYWDINKASEKSYGNISPVIKTNMERNEIFRNIDEFYSKKPDGMNYSIFVTEAYYNNVSAKDYFTGIYKTVE